MQPALLAFVAFVLVALFGRLGSAQGEEKYSRHQKAIFNLFLPGTESKMDEALLEFDKRVLGADDDENVKKLASEIVLKRFENTVDNQKRALEYYLLTESRNHLGRDLEAVRARTAEIKAILENYEAHLAELGERQNKLKNKKAKTRKSPPKAWADDSDKNILIIGSEETVFFQLKLPTIKPASLKKNEEIKDDELPDEVLKVKARRDMLKTALQDLEFSEKAAGKLSKAILNAMKTAYDRSIVKLDNTSQI